MIEVKDVYKTYLAQPVLKGVNLKINSGETLAIRGASGSGKSTLLYMLGGLERPDKGEVIVNSNRINKMSDEELAQFRNTQIGFVFQFHFLLPSLTARANILLPSRLGEHSAKEVEKRTLELSRRLGVEACLDKWPHQLSGGEQQRINLVRALSLRPQVLLCDEPTGNLDSRNSANVVQLLKELSTETNCTLIVVTHDDSVASAFSRKIVIEDGVIIL